MGTIERGRPRLEDFHGLRRARSEREENKRSIEMSERVCVREKKGRFYLNGREVEGGTEGGGPCRGRLFSFFHSRFLASLFAFFARSSFLDYLGMRFLLVNLVSGILKGGLGVPMKDGGVRRVGEREKEGGR